VSRAQEENEPMPRAKVGVVGAGQVGATLAMRLAERGICDVAMVDVVKGMPQGKALATSS
jgi:malate dehydrogenase